MSKDLVIVFVAKDDSTLQYLEPMGLADLGDEIGKNAAGIGSNERKFLSQLGGTSKVDVILLPDGELGPHSDQAHVLKEPNGLRERVFVSYHRNSTSKSRQELQLKEIFGDAMHKSRLDHRDSGPVFDALLRIAGCASDQHQYAAALRDLIFAFTGDPILEAKLELLHLCLTGPGAAVVVSETCPDNILSVRGGFWSDPVILGDRQATVQEAVQTLAGFEKSQCFSTLFLEHLCSLRSGLFKKSKPEGMTATVAGI